MDPASVDTPMGAKTCPECGRVFTKPAHLLRHVRSHAQQKPFECSVCRKSFGRTDALQRHERTVHSAKRQRTDEENADLSEAGFSNDGDPGQSSSNPFATTSEADRFAANAVALHGWYGEQPGTLLSPSTAFAGIEAHGDGDMFHPKQPPTPSTGVHGLLSNQATFLSSLPTAMPTTGAEINDMIAGWLNPIGGALATEHALAAVFAGPTHLASVATGGGFESYPLSLQHSLSMTDDSLGAQMLDMQATPQSQYPDASSPVGSISAPDPHRRPPSMLAINGGRPARRASRTVVTADTWESGKCVSRSASRPESPQPSFTSPEQVVGQLDIRGPEASMNAHDRGEVIPSMKFLDACLHLYFRDFHPSFPIIHKPTFQRDRTSPLLLLSMCSIGCMFVGTQAARDNGLWIYQRLHVATVLARDTYMATEATRLGTTLSALLGQAFSFLYGQPKQMLTAECFHGTVATMSRRNGLFTKVKPNPITYDLVQHLDSDALERKWRQWGREETFRRISLGLTIHGAELTIFSGIARLISAQVSREDGFSDALFEAEDAQTWRTLLLNCHPQRTSDHLGTPETFLPTVLLAQSIVQMHQLSEFEKTPFGDDLPLRKLSGFLGYMMDLAKDVAILSTLRHPMAVDTPSHLRAFSALWHYTFIVRLSPLSLIEEASGRGGTPPSETIAEIQAWVNTPSARLATLHCGHILHQTANLTDLGFLLPRAIFQASLVLLCYLSFVTASYDTNDVVDALQVVDWKRLVQLYDRITNGSVIHHSDSSTSEERYVADGTCTVRVKGLIDGKEKQMDIFSLRSTSNRLLRRCTPWAIGDRLGDILSNLSF